MPLEKKKKTQKKKKKAFPFVSIPYLTLPSSSP